jgi:solute carrier family 25 oxoglutarate transporter 11
MRQAVYGTARLGLHRQFSNILKERQGGGALPVHLKIASSMSSGAIASFIGNPFDVSLVRMQSDTMRPAAERRNYKSVFDALIRITREEGLTRLWRGAAPTIVRAMAMNVGMMASYDQAKELYTAQLGAGLTTNLLSSATAGFTCAFASLPFDLIKTRLQSMKPDPTTGKNPYSGFVDCGAQIARTEGVLAFWTGFGAYYARCAPHAMIILLTLETYNIYYSKVFGTEYKH